MDWKNQLTKTPYLVLFIMLGAVGVGTASALATYTFTGDVIVTDDLYVGTINAEDNDKIFFDDGTETLMWQNTNSQFELSDGLLANGDLITTTDVEGETFVLGPSNSGDNDFIFFDFISEHLVWKDSADRFEFSNDLFVNGEVNCPTCTLGFYHKTHDAEAENLVGVGTTVDCDTGDTPIGGSFEGFINVQSVRLAESKPSSDGDGWNTGVLWNSVAGVNDFIRFGVMCADHPPVHIP